MHLTHNVTFILVAVYVHQKTSYADLETFLNLCLSEYSNLTLSGDFHIPMVMMGDFDSTIQNREKLAEFLRKHYNLTLKYNLEEATTLGRTCTDLTFSRIRTWIANLKYLISLCVMKLRLAVSEEKKYFIPNFYFITPVLTVSLENLSELIVPLESFITRTAVFLDGWRGGYLLTIPYHIHFQI